VFSARHLYVIGIILPLTVIGCRSTNSSRGKDVVPFTTGDVEPILGQGYDSLVQELRQASSCVSGQIAKVGTNAGSINLGQNVSSDSIMKELSGEVKGTAKVAFMDVGAGAGFYRSINRSKSAANLVYAVRIDTGSEQLRSISLTDAAKSLSTEAMMQTCGDDYVMQINRGGMLTITLNLDFANEESRQKWQSQLKLTGPWPEVSKDLMRKLEQKGMDGTLTVNVTQLGGTPNQSLMAVRSCSMTSVEEFNTCRQRIDDLMNYASTEFPRQVESQPAVLNYITAPLKNLGVKGLPTLSDEIIAIRSELEKMRQNSLTLESALSLAKDKNLELDSALAGSVKSNADRIKQLAKACFSYQLTTAGAADFGACTSQFAQLNGSLQDINRAALDIKELGINGDSQIGNSIVNSTTKTITVAYAIGAGKTWDYGKKIPVGVDGVPTDGSAATLSSNSLSPTDKLGALLLRVDQTYRRADSAGRVDIAPGESISFVMNDGLGDYGDNVGAQQVYWRCVNCRDQDEKRQTYRLRVKASDQEGVVFRNPDGITATYHVAAYGKWRSSRFAAFSSPQGLNNECGGSCAMSSAPSQSLVMVQGTYSPVLVGSRGNIGIKPSEPARFTLNDSRSGYGDNEGEIEIILQCVKCNLASHALILDPEED